MSDAKARHLSQTPAPITRPAIARRQRLRADLTLLTVAAIWGSAFAVQRVAASHLGPFIYSGARFLLGALTIFPFTGIRLGPIPRLVKRSLGNTHQLGRRWRSSRQQGAAQPRVEPGSARFKGLRGGMLAGSLLFGGAVFEQAGLRFTTAGKAGFITALYVVLVPLFLALGWRQRPRRSVWAASLLAATGLFLLSTGGRLALAPGDGLILVGAVFWALHVILISRLAQRVNVLRLALVQYLVCGLLSTCLGLVLEFPTPGEFASAWWTVAYAGIVSVGLGYTLQLVGQRVAPPTDATVILSTETVFAALSGWLFLGETLTTRQLLGCGFMLAATLLAQASAFARRQASRAVRFCPSRNFSAYAAY